MSRSKRRTIAKETIEILENGFYTSESGLRVDLQSAQADAVKGSLLYRPADFDAVHAEAQTLLDARSDAPLCQLKIEEATTFAGVRQLLDAGKEKVICLNFASAKNPGGGFLGGSQAQEEALARASGLYPCLSANFGYYEFNRAKGGAIYSHHLIYSPSVPVFRNDDDELLDEYYVASIITAPAVNVGALPKKKVKKETIREIMLERTENVLATALTQGYSTLVLGAWGCGVFRNDPHDMAGYFKHFLGETGKYARAFDEVVFAIPGFSSSKANLAAFRKVFDA
jgi:uncharacterized protein (TIGR02452 family)